MEDPETIAWRKYVDEILMCEVHGHKLTASAIFERNQEFLLAESDDFPTIQGKEMEEVLKEFKRPGSTSMLKDGFTFGGQNYSKVEGGEPDEIIGVRGGFNIIFKMTAITIVIGIYETGKPEVPDLEKICNGIVRHTANFLLGCRL